MMKFNSQWAAALLSVAAWAAVPSAGAALINRGDGMIYDTALNVTWLSNADLAATDSFGVLGIASGGQMTWSTAQDWITAMNASGYLGYSNWRQPTTQQPDSSCSVQSGGNSYGSNCTGSEMGELFYNELGGTAGANITVTHNSNLGLFQNVKDDVYWSGTEYAPGTSAWQFNFANGNQFINQESTTGFGWAVRSGDVAVVPIPQAEWLFASGLLCLMAVSRRKKA